MKIGIIVYSFSGHTLAVATELHEKLAAAGHQVTLEKLETVSPLRRGDTTAELKTRPAVDTYDALIFACPVRGGTPAPPMRIYLEQVEPLGGKPAACLVTGVMPVTWGRQQALAQMKQECESKGATVRGSESVWWGPGRKQQISETVDRLSVLF